MHLSKSGFNWGVTPSLICDKVAARCFEVAIKSKSQDILLWIVYFKNRRKKIDSIFVAHLEEYFNSRAEKSCEKTYNLRLGK